ncbi:MAG: hypothetical protein IPF44_11365 [Betaproteobacteria bacterium]|nr:hypothetical protein [Betaproteobacteria bacterium]
MVTMKTMGVVLADDQLLIRAGIRAIIDTLPGYRVERECADSHGNHCSHSRTAARCRSARHRHARTIWHRGRAPFANLTWTPQFWCYPVSTVRKLSEQALAAGVNGYLLKDFVLEEHVRLLLQRLKVAASCRRKSRQ